MLFFWLWRILYFQLLLQFGFSFLEIQIRAGIFTNCFILAFNKQVKINCHFLMKCEKKLRNSVCLFFFFPFILKLYQRASELLFSVLWIRSLSFELNSRLLIHVRIFGQPVPVLCHPHSDEVQMNFPCFICALCLSSCHWKEYGPTILTLSLNICVYMDMIPSVFSSPG